MNVSNIKTDNHNNDYKHCVKTQSGCYFNRNYVLTNSNKNNIHFKSSSQLYNDIVSVICNSPNRTIVEKVLKNQQIASAKYFGRFETAKLNKQIVSDGWKIIEKLCLSNEVLPHLTSFDCHEINTMHTYAEHYFEDFLNIKRIQIIFIDPYGGKIDKKVWNEYCLDLYKNYLNCFFQRLEKKKSKDINYLIDKAKREVRYLGLSPETVKYVKQAENMGVCLDITDNPNAAKDIVNELKLYKKMGLSLINNIKCNGIFDTQGVTETVIKTQAQFTPNLRLISLDAVSFFDEHYLHFKDMYINDLKHEFTHFWHSLNLGEDELLKLKRTSIYKVLNDKEVQIVKNLLHDEDENAVKSPAEIVACAGARYFNKVIPSELKAIVDKFGFKEPIFMEAT